MKLKFFHYIHILFLFSSLDGLFAQDLLLKLSSKKKNETVILNKIDYQKKHIDTTSIYSEIKKISIYLKNIGYFINVNDSVKQINQNYVAYFTLNDKIDKAIIKLDSNSNSLIKNIEINSNTFSIPIKKLKTTLANISEVLDKQGKSFSKVRLKNIFIKNKTLFADLEIYQSNKRTIDKIILKGYEDFPKSYLKNYFNIKPNTIFNQKKIKQISEASKSIQFIKEIKPPEVLFTKDSTLIYMYFKKNQNNSFDGIVNFASKENGDLLLNGNINLKLNNILNTGEKFELFWNSIAEERQEFKLKTEIPYLFNSKLSPQLSFLIYKQDSTFLNTKFDSKLLYSINPKIKLGLSYNSESSENLDENINNNIETFSNHFFGFQFQFNIPKNDFFFNNKFFLEINPSFGNRKTDGNISKQFKIESTTSYIFDLNLRNSIFIKNKIGFLNSDNFIDNELFRIGGANSIRGFNEQSIFTNSYTYFNIEYRYLTSEKSYIYTISDFAKIKNISSNNNLYGLGTGYRFFTKNSLVNLSAVIGKSSSLNFNFKNTKIIISWTAFF